MSSPDEAKRLRRVFDRVCEGLADLLPDGVRVSDPEEAIAATRAEVQRLQRFSKAVVAWDEAGPPGGGLPDEVRGLLSASVKMEES